MLPTVCSFGWPMVTPSVVLSPVTSNTPLSVPTEAPSLLPEIFVVVPLKNNAPLIVLSSVSLLVPEDTSLSVSNIALAFALTVAQVSLFNYVLFCFPIVGANIDEILYQLSQII